MSPTLALPAPFRQNTRNTAPSRTYAHPLTTLRHTFTRSARLLIGNRRRIRLRRIYESLNPTA